MSNTLHADDFAVRCTEEHTTTTVHRIQNTINEVCSWTESWALQLNTTKMVSTLFTMSTVMEKVSLELNNQPVPQVEALRLLAVTLDTRLTWKPHLDSWSTWIQAYQNPAIMKKLAGTTLGTNFDILKPRHPKTGLHRGCKTSCWIHLHNLKYYFKLQQKLAGQSAANRPKIFLRCYEKHTNPEMEKIADLQPLQFRREYKAAIQREKLKKLTSHPLHQKLYHGTKTYLKMKATSTSWRTY